MNEKQKKTMSWGKRILPTLLALTLAGTAAFGTLLGIVLTGSRDQIHGEPQVMIILGCQVHAWGPSVLLQDRLDTALDYLEDHPDMTVVVSGGQGPDEHTTEARAMADYLIERGIPAGQILLEEQSHNTNQNLRYTIALLKDEGYSVVEEILVVSNGFHLARIRMLWHRITGGGENLSTLAAPSSHDGARMAMYIREPIALVKSFVLDVN